MAPYSGAINLNKASIMITANAIAGQYFEIEKLLSKAGHPFIRGEYKETILKLKDVQKELDILISMLQELA